jgi:hypothetical protein
MGTFSPGASEGRRTRPTADSQRAIVSPTAIPLPDDGPASATGCADDPPQIDLSDIPLRELLQRLVATQEAFSALKADPVHHGGAMDDVRRGILKRQGALVRELRRRRDFRRSADPAQRQPSAAWPPPSW